MTVHAWIKQDLTKTEKRAILNLISETICYLYVKDLEAVITSKYIDKCILNKPVHNQYINFLLQYETKKYSPLILSKNTKYNAHTF